jgi:hypothetical protein
MADNKGGPTVGNVAMAFIGAMVETPRAMISPWAAGVEAVWRDISKHTEPEPGPAQKKKVNTDKPGTLKHR